MLKDQSDEKIRCGAEPAVTATVTFEHAVHMVKAGHSVDRSAAAVYSELTKKERLSLLDGDVPFWEGLRGILFDRYNRAPFVLGCIPRLKIPGIRFTDGPRGIVMNASTCFPVSMARGATWDVDLEQRIGHAIGLEGRAQGANYFAGICINLPRHPAWGRIQETYGEDPILLGEFGVALHRGVCRHLMTCVKHYALNSMENARFKVDVKVDDAALHQVYLPHFRLLVEAGVTSVMSSYNSVRGEYAGQNRELLTDILRRQWGFDGFVISDFIFGLRDAIKSIQNGLDIEAPFSQQRALHVSAALADGRLQWSDIDLVGMRILRKQLEHVVRTGLSVPELSVVFCDRHRALAREAAARSMVLLKNDNSMLPVDPTGLRRVAVVGRLANIANTGDRGSSAVFAPSVTTAFEGLQAAMPSTEVLLEDTDDVGKARSLAEKCELVVCVVGYDASDEGEYVVPSFKDNRDLVDLLPPTYTRRDKEVYRRVKGEDHVEGSSDGGEGITPGAGGDRRSLRLRDRDVEILRAVTAVNSKTVVSIVAAGPVLMEEWIEQTSTVIMAWYNGCEGGHALADVLLGKIDASGRLPFSVPTNEAHLANFQIDATEVTYNQWFGQRLLDKLDVTPRFPLGYGLSYTTFSSADFSADTTSLQFGLDRFVASVSVTNTGTRRGRYVAQVYGTTCGLHIPSRVLLGFNVIDLAIGESRSLQIPCSTRPVQRWKNGKFSPVSSTLNIELGVHARDEHYLRTVISF